MAENVRALLIRTSRTGKELAGLTLRVAETSFRISTEVGKTALDVSVQITSAARAAGLPIPDHRVERIKRWQAEHERAHHERTAFFLGSLYLAAKKHELRHEPYNVPSEPVLDVLQSFCEETHVDVKKVMDPHAGKVVEDALEHHTPQMRTE